jgi:hypothetical protein
MQMSMTLTVLSLQLHRMWQTNLTAFIKEHKNNVCLLALRLKVIDLITS